MLTFWNSLSSPFIYDDASSVTNNPTIREWRTAWSPPPHDTPVSGRPVVNLSLAANYAIGGLDPRGYHVANVAIHIACALLLFEILRVSDFGMRISTERSTVRQSIHQSIRNP